MKNKNILIYIMIIVTLMLNFLNLTKYERLNAKTNKTIKISDLPEEFSQDALKTINDFIQKTHNLNYEIVIYFDYITGEILKCGIGSLNRVKLKFVEGEFEGHSVASIHNHPQSVYSPPSDKNFGILMRDFEDYELVVSIDELWVLKAKCVNPILHIDLKMSAEYILDSCQEYCTKLYSNNKKADEVCNIMYGTSLLNYINDKNIKNTQLTKKKYQT